MSEWQPIETAPKDRKYKLLFVDGEDGGEVFSGVWDNFFNVGWMAMDKERGSYIAPTHWMPFPEPPKTGA